MASISASASLSILNFLSDLYDPSSTMVNVDLVEPTPTIIDLGKYQTLRAAPVMEAGKCKTYELWYYDTSNITGAALDHDGTTPQAYATCDVASGQEVDTAKQAYTPNVYLTKNFSVAGSRCGNESDLVREVGLGLNAAMVVLRKQANLKAIDLLDANVFGATSPFFGTAGVADDYVFENGTWDETTLSSMEITAGDELIPPGFRFIHGKNFRKLWHDSRYTRLNDNGVSESAQLDSYQHTWDLRNVDSRTGHNTSFLYNPAVIGIFSQAIYEGFGQLTAVPQMIGGRPDLRVWAIPDPFITYNVVSENGGSQMKNFEYIVTEQITCNGKNSNGDLTYQRNYSVELRAMMDIAPTGPAGHTGIMGWANNTPA